MPLAQQVFGGHARALPVLDADGVKGRVLDVAVHQDDGHVHAAQLLQIAPRIGAHDDNAVHAPVLGHAHIALVLLRAAEQQVVAVFAGRILDGAEQFPIEGIGKHEFLARLGLRNEHADEVGAAAGQAAGVEVGHIVEPAHRLQHALCGFGADGFIRIPVKHVGHRSGGHAGFTGDILDAYALHGPDSSFQNGGADSLKRFSDQSIPHPRLPVNGVGKKIQLSICAAAFHRPSSATAAAERTGTGAWRSGSIRSLPKAGIPPA